MPRELYVPDFRVLIDGAEMRELRRAITSVSLTTGLEGADRVELVVANQARFWVDDPRLEVRPKDGKQQAFELHLGYLPGELEPMFFGELTGLTASFPSSGMPQLTVTAQDKRHRMKESKRNAMHTTAETKGNKPVPDAQLTTDVARVHGLTVRRDEVGGKLARMVDAAIQLELGGDPDSQQKGSRRQANETDYDLLRRIARESGWEMVVDHTAAGAGKVLRFMQPSGSTRAEVELEYGLSLIDFTPKESVVGQVRSVSTSLKVPATGVRQGVKLEVNDDLTQLTLSVTPDPPAPPRTAKPEDAVVIQEPLTPATAPRRLLGELLTRTNERLTGSGSTVGDPRIKAGTVLSLTGMGLRFGGLYRVTSATHSIDSGGYKTRFDVRKEVGLNGLNTRVQGASPARKPSPKSS